MTGDKTYTRALADEVVERLCAGETLRQMCRENQHLPSEYAVRSWARDDVDGFATRYARAREIWCDVEADRITEIADELIDGEDSAAKSAAVQRNRLRVDARKWTLSKVAPKRYGDKSAVDLNVSGDFGALLDQARQRAESMSDDGDGADGGADTDHDDNA